MLKKLKHRFTAITMALLSVAVIITFSTLIVTSSNRMTQESIRNLEDAFKRLSPSGTAAPPDNPFNTDLANLPSGAMDLKDKPFDGQSPFSTFFIAVDDSGSIITVQDFSRNLNESISTDALAEAQAEGSESGIIPRLNLRFAKFTDDSGATVYGFIDVSYQRSLIRTQVIIYSSIGLASLFIFFLISLFLSGMAIKPVEKAWRQQQQFVADASHELKTPITVMLANTSILLNNHTYDKKTAVKWISYIDLEAKRMKKLVEDLLFLARLDNKENPYQMSTVSLSDIVTESVLPFEAVLFETGKRLNTDIQPGLLVCADPHQLTQLIGILLDNANKYADNHLPVTVRLKGERNMASLSVTSFGEPIDKETLPYIFNRFFRGDKARSRNQNSYGLGLSIAKEIVESYHGKITVKSDALIGTVFTVFLPLC